MGPSGVATVKEQRRQKHARLRNKRPVYQVINALLAPDEEILWQEQPIPKYAVWTGLPGNWWVLRALLVLAALIVVQPFSLSGVYLAFVSFRSVINPVTALSIPGGILMGLAGLLLAIGPYYCVLRTRINAWRNAKYIHYVLTNRRAMVLLIRDGKLQDQHVKALQHIENPRVKMLNLRGFGDVIFDAGGEVVSSDTTYTTHYDIGFEGIADAEHVLWMLEQAVHELSARRRGRPVPAIV